MICNSKKRNNSNGLQVAILNCGLAGRLALTVGAMTVVILGLDLLGCTTKTPVKQEQPPIETRFEETPILTSEKLEISSLPPAQMLDADITASGETAIQRRGVRKIEMSPVVMTSIATAKSKFEEKKYEDAFGILNAVRPTDDGAYLAYYNEGVMNERRGRQGEAEERYNAALDVDADFSPALIALVKLYVREGKMEEAEEVVRIYIRKRPDNVRHRIALYLIDYARGNYEGVIKGVKDLLRRDEKNVDMMELLALANVKLGHHELAKAILRRGMELEPERGSLYGMYGNILYTTGDEVAAREYLEKSVSYEPEFVQARNNLGLLYHHARDNGAAIKELKLAIENDPKYKEAYLNLGNSYKAEKHYAEAEEAYRRAIAIDATYADPYYAIGTLYLDGRFEGLDEIMRLEKGIENLKIYKEKRKGVEEKDLVDSYIEEGEKGIANKRKLKEMSREAQKGSY